jgi:hypothetical protein
MIDSAVCLDAPAAPQLQVWLAEKALQWTITEIGVLLWVLKKPQKVRDRDFLHHFLVFHRFRDSDGCHTGILSRDPSPHHTYQDVQPSPPQLVGDTIQPLNFRQPIVL